MSAKHQARLLEPLNSKNQIYPTMRTAVYAGSFDPLTNGHLWMIEKGLELFDRLYVAIGSNPSKSYTFSVKDRLSPGMNRRWMS